MKSYHSTNVLLFDDVPTRQKIHKLIYFNITSSILYILYINIIYNYNPKEFCKRICIKIPENKNPPDSYQATIDLSWCLNDLQYKNMRMVIITITFVKQWYTIAFAKRRIKSSLTIKCSIEKTGLYYCRLFRSIKRCFKIIDFAIDKTVMLSSPIFRWKNSDSLLPTSLSEKQGCTIGKTELY